MAILDSLNRSANATLTGEAMAAALLQKIPNMKPIKVEQSDEYKAKQDNLIAAVEQLESAFGVKSDKQIEVLTEILSIIKNIREKQYNPKLSRTVSGTSIGDPNVDLNKVVKDVVKNNMSGGMGGMGSGGRGGDGGLPNIPVPPGGGGGSNRKDINNTNYVDTDFVKELGLGSISTYLQAAVGYGLMNGLNTFIESTGVKLTDAFTGVFAEEFAYSTQMKKNANMTRDFGVSLQDVTNDYLNFGDVVYSTGKSRQEFQQEWLDNSKKGFGYELRGGKLEKKNAKDQQRMLKNSLNLATVLDMSTSSTAEMFDHWSRSLQMSNTQLFSIGNSMKNISRETGVSGDNMLEVAKKTEVTLQLLRKSSNLSSSTTASMIRSAALASKFGVEDITSELDQGISSFENFVNMQDKTKQAFLARAIERGGLNDELQSGELATEEMRPQFDKSINEQIVETMNQAGLNITDPTKITSEIYKLELELLKAREAGNVGLMNSLTDQIRDVKLLPQKISGFSAAELEALAKKNIEEMKTPLDRMAELQDQLKTANNDIQKESLMSDIEAIKKSISQSAINTYSEIMDVGGIGINDAIALTKSKLVNQGSLKATDNFGMAEFGKMVSDNLNYLESESDKLNIDFDKELNLQGFLSKDDLQKALLSSDNAVRDKAQLALESISNSIDVGNVNKDNPVEQLSLEIKNFNEALSSIFGSFIFKLTASQLTAIIATAIALKTGIGVIGSVQIYKTLGKFLGGGAAGGAAAATTAAATGAGAALSKAEIYTGKAKVADNIFGEIYNNSMAKGEGFLTSLKKGSVAQFTKTKKELSSLIRNQFNSFGKSFLDNTPTLQKYFKKFKDRFKVYTFDFLTSLNDYSSKFKDSKLVKDGFGKVRQVGNINVLDNKLVRGALDNKLTRGLAQNVDKIKQSRLANSVVQNVDKIKQSRLAKGVLENASKLKGTSKILSTGAKIANPLTSLGMVSKVGAKAGARLGIGAATGGTALVLFAAIDAAMGAWDGYKKTPELFAESLRNADGSMREATVGMKIASTYGGALTGILDGLSFGLLGLIGLKEPLQKIITWISYTVINAIENIGKGIADGFMSIWGEIKPVFSQIGTIFTNTFNKVGDTVLDVVKSVSGLFGVDLSKVESLGEAFSNIWKKMEPVFYGIGYAIGHVGGTLLKLVGKILTPFVQILGDVVSAAFKILGGVVKIIAGVVGFIYNAFAAVYGGIIGIFSGDFSILKEAWGGITNSLSVIGDGLLDIVKGVFGGILDVVTTTIKGVWTWFYDLYMWLVGGSLIPDLIEGIKSWMARLPGIFFDSLFALPKLIFKGVLLVGKSIVSGISYLFKSIPDILDFGFGVLGDIGSLIWDGIKNIPGLLWGGVKTMFSLGVVGLKFGSVLWEGIKTVPDLLYDGMKNALTNAWNYFTGQTATATVAKNLSEQNKSITERINVDADLNQKEISSINDPNKRLELIRKKREENDKLRNVFTPSMMEGRDKYQDSIKNPGMWGTKDYFYKKQMQPVWQQQYEGGKSQISAIEDENRMLADLEEKTLKEIEAQTQSNLIQEKNSTTTAETMKMGQQKGSIYTHDTHSEFFLKQILLNNADNSYNLMKLLSDYFGMKLNFDKFNFKKSQLALPVEDKVKTFSSMVNLGAFENNFTQEGFEIANSVDSVKYPNIDNNFNQQGKEVLSKIIDKKISESSMINLGAFDNNLSKEGFESVTGFSSVELFDKNKDSKIESSMINLGAFDNNLTNLVNDELISKLETQEKVQSNVINTGVFEPNQTAEVIDVDNRLLRSFVSSNVGREISVGANMYTPEDAADYVMQQLAGNNPDNIVGVSGMEYLNQLTEEQNITLVEMLNELRKFNSFKFNENSDIISSQAKSAGEKMDNNQITNYKKKLLRGNWTDLQVVASSPQSNYRIRPR